MSDDGCSPDEYGYASDEYGSLQQYRDVISEICYKLENLNFADHNYNKENNDVVQVDIMNFNPRKLTVERNGDVSWNVLYDNKTLVLNLKSFSGVICRSKRLPRQKYVRINNLFKKDISRNLPFNLSFDQCQGIS